MQNSERQTRTTKQIGDYAEQLAREYLETKGYKTLTKNYRYKNIGELDLVMTDSETLVFVEVRYRVNRSFGLPEATIGPTKQKRIRRTAEAYLLTSGIKNKPCRFDVIGVDIIGGHPVIRHLINCM